MATRILDARALRPTRPTAIGSAPPSLGNVALTGLWGHDGALDAFRAVVLHHLRPRRSLRNYDLSQIVMLPRPDLDGLALIVRHEPVVTAFIAAAIESPPSP